MQRPSIFKERPLIFRRVLLHREAGSSRVADDLVVHVGDIHDVFDLVSAKAQIAGQQIDRDEGSKVADVAVVVDGWSAGVHADFVVR